MDHRKVMKKNTRFFSYLLLITTQVLLAQQTKPINTNMNYTHTIQPAIQVLSTNSHSFSLINHFRLHNSSSNYYSYQKSLDDYIVKGKNSLKIFIKPTELEHKEEASISVFINTFSGYDEASGVKHSESHDTKSEMLADDVFLSNPKNAKSIVRLDFKYDHSNKKESIESSISKDRFNITIENGKLIKEYDPNGNYLFDNLNVEKTDRGFYKISIDFFMFEDRPYSYIYTADDIPANISDNSDILFNTPHQSVLESLFAENKIAYDIIKAKKLNDWSEYISPVTTLFRNNPVFKDILSPNMELEIKTDMAVKQMECVLDNFPEIDDKTVTPKLVLNNKLAVIEDAIYYGTNKYYYSLSINIYYAYKDGKWIVSYIDFN